MSRFQLTVTTIVIVAGSVLHGARPYQDTTLAIGESGPNYVLTVPVSQLILTMPKRGLVADKASGNPTYFKFNNKAEHLIVSGWFSPASGFRGIKQFWAAESANWKQRTGFPDPNNVTFEEMGAWNLVFYDVEFQGMTSANVRAHWVEAGTWIDVHLSKTSDRAAGLRTDLRNVLTTITVTVRKYGSVW